MHNTNTCKLLIFTLNLRLSDYDNLILYSLSIANQSIYITSFWSLNVCKQIHDTVPTNRARGRPKNT